MQARDVLLAKAMKEFYYKGAYTKPPTTEDDESDSDTVVPPKEDSLSSNKGSAQSGDSPQTFAMCFHLDVFELANELEDEEFQRLAVANLVEAIEADCVGDTVVETISTASDVASDIVYGGEILRTALADSAARNVGILCKEANGFLALVDEAPEFVKELLRALGRQRPFGDTVMAVTCRACFMSWTTSTETRTNYPRCPNASCNPAPGRPGVLGTKAQRSIMTCKGSGCDFVFEVVWWKQRRQFICPFCKWRASAEEWAKAVGGQKPSFELPFRTKPQAP